MTRQYNSEELAVIVEKAKGLNDILLRRAPNVEELPVVRQQILNLVNFFPNQEQRSKFLNYSDENLDTPLITAAMCSSEDVVKFLLDLGANKDARNKIGNKVFDVIRDYGDGDKKLEDMANLISSYEPQLVPSPDSQVVTADILNQHSHQK